MPYRLIHSGCLDDTSVQGDVAFEDAESAVFGVGVLKIPDAAAFAVIVHGVIICLLGAHPGGKPVCRCAAVYFEGFFAETGSSLAIALKFFAESHPVNSFCGRIHKSALCELLHDGGHPSCTVHVLDMVFCSVRGNLADARNPS